MLLAKRSSRHEVINDTDGELINLYRQMRHHLPAVVRELRMSVDSRCLFAMTKGNVNATEIQRASDYAGGDLIRLAPLLRRKTTPCHGLFSATTGSPL